jgi:hypothetical protein
MLSSKEFDSQYPDVTGADSHLADEWSLFIRGELNMVVQQVRGDWKIMDQGKRFAGPLFVVYWSQIMAINGGEIQKVKLAMADKCLNLPASTIGSFIR